MKILLSTRVKWSLLLGAAIFVVLGFVGNTYARRREAEDLGRFSPRGQMISVPLPGGEVRVHLYCTGVAKKGAPAVILIHGGGDNALVWSRVQPEVARATRVCSYDRPGYGWSEAGAAPRSAAQNAMELHLMLSRAGIEPPYLLVAHSIGGLIAHRYAHEYSGEVAGLVLLDSMLAEQMVAQGTFWMRLPLLDTAVCRLASASGLYRLLFDAGRLAPDEPVTKLPAELQPEALALRLRIGLCQATYAEQAAAIQDVLALHEAGGLGDLPVAVLDAYETEVDRKGLEERQVYARRLSTQITYKSIGPSGHHIQLDQPGEVVRAILRMVE